MSKKIDLKVGGFLIAYQIIVIIGVPIYFFYFTPALSAVVWAVVLLFATGMAITAGYHRYYAHKSYNLNKVVEAVLLFFGTLTLQGSVLQWSHDHRLHHRHTDTEKDPYSVTKGFWHAHMLWVLWKRPKMDMSIVTDLTKNKLVMFQHKHYISLTLLTNHLVFVLIGGLTGDWIGSYVIATWLRIFVLHHFTWFINSLAHMLGERTYSREQSAADNFLVAFLTFGEGYHNYHHAFSADYRNGIKWYHYDPSKWLVWTLEKLNLASNLKRVNKYSIKKVIINEDKRILLEMLSKKVSAKKKSLEKRIQSLSESISNKLAQYKEMKAGYKEYKSTAKKKMVKAYRQKIRVLRKSMRKDWTAWRRLDREVNAA